jgi:hypothetical protein
MVQLPVPHDRFARLGLLFHESFHRAQPALGLGDRDALNPHLDERDGRFWLRLELRALARALRSSGASRTAAVRDAVVFRRARHDRFPGAVATEDALERQEGLPEYTGARLALDALHVPIARVADDLAAFESRPTFARSLGYGTGPALGLLLDDLAPGWRKRAGQDGLAAQLAAAIDFSPPADLLAAATAAARRYSGDELARAEDAHAAERARQLAALRARLVDGPVVRFAQRDMSMSFDPSKVVSLGSDGAVHPTGHFAAAWGTLDVTGGGALVAPDLTLLRVQAPASAPRERIVHGPDWRLELAARSVADVESLVEFERVTVDRQRVRDARCWVGRSETARPIPGPSGRTACSWRSASRSWDRSTWPSRATAEPAAGPCSKFLGRA